MIDVENYLGGAFPAVLTLEAIALEHFKARFLADRFARHLVTSPRADHRHGDHDKHSNRQQIAGVHISPRAAQFVPAWGASEWRN